MDEVVTTLNTHEMTDNNNHIICQKGMKNPP